MTRRIWKTGIVSVSFLILLSCVMFSRAANIYSMWINDVSAYASENVNWELKLRFTGANLLRANSFYLNGRRVDECYVSRVTYDVCDVFVNKNIFGNDGEWHEFELGFTKEPFIKFLSTPAWVEWEVP